MNDDLKKEIEEVLAAGEAFLGEAFLEEMKSYLAIPLTPAEELRRHYFVLYEQICFQIWLGKDLTGDEFVEDLLKAIEEEKLKDSAISAVRKKHKLLNEHRAKFEEAAREQGGKAERIICEIMPRWLEKLDAALAKELTARRKARKLAKIEAARKRLIEANPYSGQFREQYKKRETRERYLPMPQNKAIFEYLFTPCTERNSEITESGDTLVRARRGYSYLVFADGRRDEKTGELIEMTRSNSFTAACTLMQLMLQIPRQDLDPSYPKLVLSLDEMMALRGLKNEQNARIQIARDLQILQCTTIPATDERLLGRHYSILQERDVPKRGDKVTAVFGRAFYEEIMQWRNNLMPLPTSLLAMNAEYDGLALICGLQLAFSQFYRYGERRCECGVKGSTIAQRAECLLPSEADLRAGGRHYTQQRIDPIFKAVDRLNRNLDGAAMNVDLRRLSDFSLAERGDDFNAICLNATEWAHYPDITAERAEAKKARAAKRNAGKEGKK